MGFEDKWQDEKDVCLGRKGKPLWRKYTPERLDGSSQTPVMLAPEQNGEKCYRRAVLGMIREVSNQAVSTPHI